jgi:curli production assembly/transport component CsgG
MRYILLLFLLLTGCQTFKVVHEPHKIVELPEIAVSPLSKQLKALPLPASSQLTVAVYQFSDKTGQRKTSDSMALFSSAVTQGAESWLIDSLQQAGNGKWFKVLERSGLDDIVKERQMYKQAREDFENTKNPGMLPMLFAGVIAEGGIIGYDSDTNTGGFGANVLSIGAQQQYRKDTITVSLRLVSTNTSEVILSVATTKTVFSTSVSGNLMSFYSNGTKYTESELGLAANEPVTLAVRAAIDSAVIELVKQGEEKGLWKYKIPPVKTVKSISIQNTQNNEKNIHTPHPPVTWNSIKSLWTK